MSEADVTYADVKFTNQRSRDNVAAEDIIYSEVKISNKRQPACKNCSANIQQSGSSRRSKVTSERLVLIVLIVLLAAALIALGVTLSLKSQLNQEIQTLKNGNEALRRNISEIQSGRKDSISTFPPPPTCSKLPEVKDLKCLKCEAGWEPHGGNCYYFNTSESTWNESRRSCRDLGGDLVKIDSREEQMFLENRLRGLMVDPEDKFWIGLTDSAEEGRWFWVDGSSLDESLSFWSSREPDDWKDLNPAGEDCVRMGEKGGAQDLKCWFDQSCNKSQKSVCEKVAEPGQKSTLCV